MRHRLSNSRPILITEIEQFGGAERSVLALSSWLHYHGQPNYILSYVDHCNLADHAKHPVEVVQLQPKAGAQNKIKALRRHLAERGLSPYRLLASGYQPALHATLAGLRGFHTLMHDTPSLFRKESDLSVKAKLRGAVSNAIVGWGLRSGGRTIVTSTFLRSECRHDFGVAADIVRMGGLGASEHPRLRYVVGKLRMLSVSRIEANKRIDWILNALGHLEKATPSLSSQVDWRLDIVGRGPLVSELKSLADTLGISNRIYFHGFISDSELDELYNNAHLFLMPAIQGYGIPAVESLQRGVPVLLHRDSGVSDILLETEWATVLIGDERNMSSALNAAITKVVEGKHHSVPLPKLPTEDDWARKIAELCAWM